MFELRQIQLALALGRYRSYTRTAEAMHISQPALSRSIANLEDTLGVQLFDRSRKTITPTAYGKLLLARGEALMLDIADLQREIGLMQGLDIGELTIAVAPYPGELSIGPTIARLISLHPNLRVDIRVLQWREAQRAVLAAEVDVGVVELGDSMSDPRLKSDSLPKHPIFFFCRNRHPITRQSAVTLAKIQAYALASVHVRPVPQMSGGSGRFDKQTGDYIAPIRVGTIQLAKQIVSASDAIGAAPLALIADEVRTGRFVALPFQEPWMTTNYGVITLNHRSPSPAAKVFLSILQTVEGETVATEKDLQQTMTVPSGGKKRLGTTGGHPPT